MLSPTYYTHSKEEVNNGNELPTMVMIISDYNTSGLARFKCKHIKEPEAEQIPTHATLVACSK